jgi:di/tricarboxylate transporter
MGRRLAIGPLAVALALLAALAVLILRPLAGAENGALALCLVAISLWATGLLPEATTALGFFTLAMLFKLAPAAVIFSGFQSGALWLILGGLVMGVAIRSTGLGDRIARSLGHAFGDSYVGVIAGMTLVGTALGFLMPSSMGRAVLLMPIALSLADGYGFVPGRPGRTGLVLAAGLGSHAATFAVLPANVPNMVFAGAAETLYGYSPAYGTYLLLHFPILGALKTAFLIPLIVWLWPDRPQKLPPQSSRAMTGGERWLALLLALALFFWATDFWHHISPAWISMVVALVLLLPRIGLVDRAAFGREVNFPTLFYIGGILGFGALVGGSGLGRDLGAALSRWLPLAANQPALNFASLGAIGTVIGFLATVTGVPAVMTPLAAGLAQASGMKLESVLMSEVLGFSTVILPYESPPLVVAMTLGGEKMGHAVKLCLWLGAITLLLLFPLDYLWWRLLGWL